MRSSPHAIDASGAAAQGFAPGGVQVERSLGEGFQGSGAFAVVAEPPGRITVAGAACRSVERDCDLVVFRVGVP